MKRSEYRRLVKEHRTAARQRYVDLKAQRKSRRAVPAAERRAARRADRAEVSSWRKSIREVEPRKERKAQRKGYRRFRRLQRRSLKLTALAAVVLLFVGGVGGWYWSATRPATADQSQASAHAHEVAQQVQAEGMVLLENEEGVLPLEDRPVSVFGIGSVTPVYGGGGAGGISSAGVVSLYTALEAAGVDYDHTIRNVYGNYAASEEPSTAEYQEPEIGFIDTVLPAAKGFLVTSPTEMPVEKLPDEVIAGAREHSDVALYVVSRAGMEGRDFTPADLRLSADERGTLELLDDSFEHVVVLVNSTNAMELGFVEEFDNVDAALWIGGPGEVGMHAVASALTGDLNPSGRLTDTYVYDNESHPAVVNTGDFEYLTAQGENSGRYFTNHLEGIYSGYRYFETFVPAERYGDVVQYPFGYGLSYTAFDWDVTDTTADADAVTVDVTVTNTGEVAGKDVVQVYYEAPYTPGGVEKPATVLGGYAKTGLLEPGDSQTVTVSFETRSMASYDDRNARTWVLDAGDYEIRTARNAHDSLSAFTYTQPETIVLDEDPTTGAEVTNRFDGADGGLTYLSRSEPKATFPTAPEDEDLLLPEGLLEADFVHEPVTGLQEPRTGADNGLVLADLEGLAMDDPRWQKFLDQLTDDELVELVGNGGYWSVGVERLGVPSTTMHDGPASIRSFLGSWATVAFPTPIVLGSTWNDELAREVGEAMGAEARSYDVDAVYAPSLDLHRSPLGGRNFEYFSEDPLLTGRVGAGYVAGLQDQGTVAVIKHFAGNVQETNRAAMGLYVWSTEQAWREMHLRPFEAAVKDGGAHGAMTAFNRIGDTWSGGSHALLTDVLRTEWGFEGFVITDAGIVGQGNHFDALQAVQAGNDLMLGLLVDTPGEGTYEKQLRTYLSEDRAATLIGMREAAHHILFYVLQTNRI